MQDISQYIEVQPATLYQKKINSKITTAKDTIELKSIVQHNSQQRQFFTRILQGLEELLEFCYKERP